MIMTGSSDVIVQIDNLKLFDSNYQTIHKNRIFNMIAPIISKGILGLIRMLNNESSDPEIVFNKKMSFWTMK
jgi:hypothetical protein